MLETADIKREISISRSALKLIAVIVMVIDHGAFALIEMGYLNVRNTDHFAIISTVTENQILWLYFILRTIGRIAFPIFCFLLVDGFFHTRDAKKYAQRLFVFALISEIPFDLMIFGHLFDWGYQNVYVTLFFGILVLIGLQKFDRQYGKQILVIFVGCGVTRLLKADYCVVGILEIALFYFSAQWKNKAIGVMTVLLAVESRANFGAAALALIPIHFYHGKRGKLKWKYIFYWIYPVHILILCGIRYFIFGV